MQVTPLKKEDVLFYKRQAMLAETQIRVKTRQKLLDKIQTVMDEIDVSYSVFVTFSVSYSGID